MTLINFHSKIAIELINRLDTSECIVIIIFIPFFPKSVTRLMPIENEGYSGMVLCRGPSVGLFLYDVGAGHCKYKLMYICENIGITPNKPVSPWY